MYILHANIYMYVDC